MTAIRTRCLALAGLVLALALALVFLLEPVDLPSGRHGPDGRNYLSLLHSLYFDQDILLYNDNSVFEQRIIVTPTGYALELHNLGTALAFLPFYALGHLTCLLGSGSCSGSDLPTFVWLSVGNWAYGLAALVLMYRMARKILSRRWAALTVGSLALGSSFFYYWTRFFNPHMPAVMLVALLAFIWDRTRDERALHHWLLMGALVGMAMTVASYNLVFLLLPGLDLLRGFSRRMSSSGRRGLLLGGALMAAGALAGLSPQLMAWRLLFGSYLGIPYGRQLFWLQPGLPDILLSSYHGLFVYAPLLLVACAGLVPLLKRDPGRALPITATLVGHVYVSSCNIAWWGGASFGARYLLSSLPLLVFPLAQLLTGVRRRKVLVSAMALSLLWAYGLLLADVGGLVDPGQYIPPAWLIRTQGEVLRKLPRLLSGHLLTPRFDTAYIYALPSGLLLAILTLGVWRIRRTPGRLWAAGAVALPVVVALLLALSDRSSQRELAQLGGSGLEGYPRSTYDLYDLSEGYWQRGAYHFVRGHLDRARDDFETARSIRPDRGWVRFHVGGKRHIPNPVDVRIDGRLTLAGWEQEPASVSLYWQTSAEVLAPGYRTVLRLTDRAGNERLVYDSATPDTWRALAGEIVRVSYAVDEALARDMHSLLVTVYPAGGPDALSHIQLPTGGP